MRRGEGMSHYFENDPKLKSDEKQIKVKINNEDFTFYVDNGVFSKKGLDFGTRSLLETISKEKIKGDILDFGCGYGPIGIYLKKIYPVTVDMIDVNKRSLKLALKNAEINKVNVNIFESDCYQNVIKKYDFIITNPPIRVGKKILYDILIGAKEHLKKDGKLIFVIHKDQGAKSTYKMLESEYMVRILDKNKGFYIIEAKIS